MNRVVAFLHIVRRQDVGHASKLVEKAIFKPEKGSWSHDRGLWEDATRDLLSSSLSSYN
jgi:hypothetical protein